MKKKTQPTQQPGRFGPYGGMFVPEILMEPLRELEREWRAAARDPKFRRELDGLLRQYVGRPTPLYHAARMSAALGPKIFLKREDLCHTGAHKINNSLAQCLLARRMGKRRVIAETGAGQHGVATATCAALFGLDCVVYMGKVDMARQALNVYRMQALGAKVVPVTAGQQTLKEAISEAMRDWVTHIRDTHYVLGTAYGAHPYPEMVRSFQSVIGKEARRQILAQEGRLPTALVACVGGGSNSIGLFSAFLKDRDVALIGVAARFAEGRVGVLQGTRTYVLQDDEGQIRLTHSVSAGLDYAAVGPEHAWLHDTSRAEYSYITDDEAIAAFHKLARWEGILAALESIHAVAWVIKHARRRWTKKDVVIINLSGRGDKDVQQIAAWEAKHGA